MDKKLKIATFIIILVMFISNVISVAALTLINSKEVLYDNTVSGLQSTTVQDAVDELYSAATDYKTLSTKLTTLQGKVSTLESQKLDIDASLSRLNSDLTSNFNTLLWIINSSLQISGGYLPAGLNFNDPDSMAEAIGINKQAWAAPYMQNSQYYSAPPMDWALLVNICVASGWFQIAIGREGIYYRTTIGGSWGAWQKA